LSDLLLVHRAEYLFHVVSCLVKHGEPRIGKERCRPPVGRRTGVRTRHGITGLRAGRPSRRHL